ncbi:MAG: sulfate adenylyltransferase, partial [Candidatus Omnitrophica bacterium]|nr:sulfate adenylyltransferase [Candidatus Omnitrophota bacterium]
MKELLPPHGGCGLINRIVAGEEKEHILEAATKGKAHTLTDADLSVFFRIADGTLSPLEGPMNEAEYLQVLNEETILRHHQLYAWTIPIAFAAPEKEAASFKVGETVLVKDLRDVVVGAIEISDIYRWDKDLYNEKVYGTDRRDHPGPRIANDDQREFLLGGKIWAFDNVHYQIDGKYMLMPKECREIFSKKGWERITAFQTRNPLHRAHEYAMVHALESLIKQGFSTGIILNPLVGETKSDDVPASVRMKTYAALIDGRLIGECDKYEAV